MSKVPEWTKEEMFRLYDLREEGLSFANIAKKLNKTKSSVNKKYKRTNWEGFKSDPDTYMAQGNVAKRNLKPWTQKEMYQLDAYIQSDNAYSFIAKQLGRSIRSIEDKVRDTDWQAWRQFDEEELEAIDEGVIEDDEKERLVEQLVNALLIHGRHDLERLRSLQEDDFLDKINLDKEKLPETFSKLILLAEDELTKLGYQNPETEEYGEGIYAIVGDSHGKHTTTEMFKLLKNIDKTIKPDKIIHIGHIMDDDNDISYNWGQFKNLVVVAKSEELRLLQDQRNRGNFKYHIVREDVSLGDLIVTNQDLISDFVKTPIRSLDPEIFDSKVVVNCHRLEFFSRPCVEGESSYIASPGCLCEEHIIKTIKQMDFKDGRTVKLANHEGFTKYRRQKHLIKYWEQGILLVHVDKEGSHTLIPCPIKKVGNRNPEYVMAYFDKMISSKGVFNPDEKIFVNADAHSDMHDCNVLDIQDQIVKDYRPDKYVNLGDAHNYHSLNHHIMDRGQSVTDKEVLEEAASAHLVLKKSSQWAKESYIIHGNHERFAKDFIKKYPQFEGLLNVDFLCALEDLDYSITDLHDILRIGDAKFIHGDVRIYGASGSIQEKASRTFGKDIFVGHVHYPAIRFGCYSLGLTGKLDQNYNEPSASQWIHGFGLCNVYKKVPFMTTIAIVDDKCIMKKGVYTPKKPSNWELKSYAVSLSFEVE
jgi:predicted DNA-binding protein YlxM (UPF0122 family)